MDRARKVKKEAKNLINDGQKPSVTTVAERLGYTEDDVHRCLNLLERQGEVQTYTKEVLGMKHRMIGVNR